MIYVEGKPDRVLVLKLTGLPGREVKRERNNSEALKRLAQDTHGRSMVDEDPGRRQPPQLLRLQVIQDLDNLGLREYRDSPRDNTVVMLRPRLEEWLVETSDNVDIDVADRRYNLPRSPVPLHRVINRDLRKLERLVDDLLAAQSPRIQKLQELLTS